MSVFILLLVIAAVAWAARYGSDSRDGRDWARQDVPRDIVPSSN